LKKTLLSAATLLALALPSYAPWWLTVSSAAFATLFGKSLFGGFGRNPFNPARLGYPLPLVHFPPLLGPWAVRGRAGEGVDGSVRPRARGSTGDGGRPATGPRDGA